MTRAAAALVLLSACALPPTRTTVADPRAAAVAAVSLRVIDASARELPSPRPGVLETLGHVAFGRPVASSSAVDAFSTAATDALRARGIRVDPAAPGRPQVRVKLRDLDVRNHDAAGAVAFVSATYALDAADGTTLWRVEQRGVAIRLAGPDLTRATLARVADDAVRAAFASLPSGYRS